MLCEVYRGYIGLGATEVFRTAAQAAADLEMVSKDTATITQYGGLLNQQQAFKYAAAQGRLRDVQQEVDRMIATMNGLEVELQGIVRELEGLGVARAGDYLKMAANTGLSFVLPIFGILSMFGIDVFGGGKAKKKKAEALMKRAEALVTQLQYWHRRRDALQTEGETLARAIDKGSRELSVQLIATPQVEQMVERVADPEKYGPNRVWRELKATDVKKVVYGREEFATQDELAQRVPGLMRPSSDRLPVGFQTVYSPVLEHGKMVVKLPTPPTLTTVPTKPRLVYGGLVSGLPTLDDVPPGVIVTGGIVVLLIAATMLQKR